MANAWQTRLAIRRANENHPWRVGDLCSAVYQNLGEGVVYRVVDITGLRLKVTPVCGVIANISNRKTRILGMGWCRPLSLVDLSIEYMNLGTFISDEVKKNAGENEQETTSEGIPTGNAGDRSDGQVLDDGCGLCADISSRFEQ